MTVLKRFNLPSSPPPTRGSGKERIQGKRTCLEIVLWSRSHLCGQEISSLICRSATAAQSICKHFMDTLAVQFGRVWIANTNQQQWRNQAETARPQPNQHKSVGETSRNDRSSLQCLSQQKRRLETKNRLAM